jgi:transcriptional regulator with XRE-family HTH domain
VSDSVSSDLSQESARNVSQTLKPLPLNELWDSVRQMPRLSEQVRIRLREELARKELSQRDMAGILGWSQSRVAHILNGRVELTVDDLADFAFGVGLTIVECVRDHGLEFCADMTPTELRFLERIRQLPQADRDAFMQILDVKTKTRVQERRAVPLHKKTRKTM